MVDMPLAGKDLGQLLLPVTLDTGDAEHFAGTELEREVTQGRRAAIVPRLDLPQPGHDAGLIDRSGVMRN